MKFAKEKKSDKKFHIVLDLDNTLISAIKVNPNQKVKKTPDFNIKVGGESFYVYKRPYLNKFLREIFNQAKSVSIWTAATKGD